MSWAELVEWVALSIDGIGVLAVVIGFVVAGVRAGALLRSRQEGAYRRLRQDLGRGVLLGLEFLVAADIIRTVAITPTLRAVTVLGLIVLIRTFLSLSLEVELEGRWPWRRAEAGRA